MKRRYTQPLNVVEKNPVISDRFVAQNEFFSFTRVGSGSVNIKYTQMQAVESTGVDIYSTGLADPQTQSNTYIMMEQIELSVSILNSTLNVPLAVKT